MQTTLYIDPRLDPLNTVLKLDPLTNTLGQTFLYIDPRLEPKLYTLQPPPPLSILAQHQTPIYTDLRLDPRLIQISCLY